MDSFLPNIPEPSHGKQVVIPDQFVNVSNPNNWTFKWWNNRGALMLETEPILLSRLL